MHDLLPYTLYPLLALLGFGFVIAIHEFGHFVFAKWAGVRVDTFSIGFGPVLLKKRVGETDYVLSLLPLGGYVKMLGQEDVPTGQDPTTADPRSYLAKSAGWKAMILLGGVLFNLVSSYLLLLALVAWGMPLVRPVVGEVVGEVVNQDGVAVESPAARLGLKRGDRLVTVDGERVRSFDDVMMAVLFAGGRPFSVEVERAGARLSLPASGAPPVEPVFDGRFGRPTLGIEPGSSTRVGAIADPGEGGLQRLDRIVAVAGQDVSALTGQELHDRLLKHFLEPIPVRVLRAGAEVEVRLTYAGQEGAYDTRAGLPVRLMAVNPAGPAGKAGLRAGDWVVAVDGVAVCGSTHFLSLVRRALDAAGSLTITVRRDTAEVTAQVVGADIFGVRRLGVGMAAPETTGVLPFLPVLPDGSPGALQRVGMQSGDALVAWRPGEQDVQVAWISRGERMNLSLGLDAAGWKTANRIRERGVIARILGQAGDQALFSRLVGRQVVAVGATSVDVVAADPGAKTEVVASALLGPAAAQLKAGDWITGARLQADGAFIEVVRGATAPTWAPLRLTAMGTALQFDAEEVPYRLPAERPVADAFELVNDAAYNLVVKSLLILPRLFRAPEDGGINPNKALVGPIGIFRELKARVERMGFDSFLKVVAMVGLNLFIVNLLPIPITDGGQLVMLGVETVIRRPLPLKLRNALMWAGVVLVGLLFAYICGLDILRWVGVL